MDERKKKAKTLAKIAISLDIVSLGMIGISILGVTMIENEAILGIGAYGMLLFEIAGLILSIIAVRMKPYTFTLTALTITLIIIVTEILFCVAVLQFLYIIASAIEALIDECTTIIQSCGEIG